MSVRSQSIGCFLAIAALLVGRLCAAQALSVESGGTGYSGTYTQYGWMGIHRDGPISADRVREEFETIKEVGFSWIRINIRWGPAKPGENALDWAPSTVERREGLYDFTLIDSVCRVSEEIGLQVLLTVRGFSDTQLYSDSVERLDRYVEFVNRLAKRAGGRIQYWQLENEISEPNFWSADVSLYVLSARKAAQAIKKQDPLATVILAGIPFSTFEIGSGTFPSSFRERRWAFVQSTAVRELINDVDIVDLHLYGRIEDMVNRIAHVKALVPREARKLRIWVTETGGPDPRVSPSKTDVQSVAREMLARFAILKAEGVEKVFWHHWRTEGKKLDSWSGMALLFKGREAPAFTAFSRLRRVFEQMRGPVSIPTNCLRLMTSNGERSTYVLVWTCNERQHIAELDTLDADSTFDALLGYSGLPVTTVSVMPRILKVRSD